MGRRDDDGEWHEIEQVGLEEDGAPEAKSGVARGGAAYGVSLAVHVALVLVLATIAITGAPPAHEKAVILVNKAVEPPPPPQDERTLVDAPPVPDPVDAIVLDPVPVPEEGPPEAPGEGQDLAPAGPPSPTWSEVRLGLGPGGGSGGEGSGAERLRGRRGTPGESAVRAALRWLASHQAPDGRWDCDGWEGACPRGGCRGPGSNHGQAAYDVGVTALALLAFLGHGETHLYGAFKSTVRRGLSWLRAQQRDDGSIGFDGGETIYNHALATLALSDAYGVTRDFSLKRFVEPAVRFCVDAQNPGLGWKYGVRPGRSDTSVTGWMVLALKSARLGGVEVPDEAFAGAQAWFARATAQGGDVGYETPGGGSSFFAATEGRFDPLPCMTAVSVLCRVLGGERRTADTLRAGVRALSAAPPVWDEGGRQVSFYYWYYGAFALFQAGDDAFEGWNTALLGALLPHQRHGGCEDGSWDPIDEWCLAGGRVYATAINALTLETCYRYARSR